MTPLSEPIIPFKTTPDQVMNLAPIMVEMKQAGLHPQLIAEAFDLARTDQGIYDLMVLWRDTTDTAERNNIVTDLRLSVSECCEQFGPLKLIATSDPGPLGKCLIAIKDV